MTIEPGNLNDEIHFKKSYQQTSNWLRKGYPVIFDRVANSVINTQMIRSDNLQRIINYPLKTNGSFYALYRQQFTKWGFLAILNCPIQFPDEIMEKWITIVDDLIKRLKSMWQT
ncbi:hypothetical protein [uncultured Methanospirillum sp.]|uniref:hypothetical protein n=1 Tax=uncultured Methanospirillum sp. TaxID=262503 RepID=UPI0029C78ECF|nr:hypothetical protein [uncultured Methanospirillum sp.]